MKSGAGGRKDYKAELIEMFNNMDIYFYNKSINGMWLPDTEISSYLLRQ